MLTATRTHTTQFHKEAFQELMAVYGDQFLSPVYVGWAKGFLDEERTRLEGAIAESKLSERVTVGHPVPQIRAFASELRRLDHASWYE
jgi:CRISPR-associated protein Cst2